jgi:hypothetical protein
VSHFRSAPANLTVLGMNMAELSENPQAAARVVHDLNAQPELPFADVPLDAAGAACRSTTWCARSRFADGLDRAPGGLLLSHLLEPVLPDQGDTRLADVVRCRARRDVAEYFRGPAAEEPTVDRRTPLATSEIRSGVWAYRR